IFRPLDFKQLINHCPVLIRKMMEFRVESEVLSEYERVIIHDGIQKFTDVLHHIQTLFANTHLDIERLFKSEIKPRHERAERKFSFEQSLTAGRGGLRLLRAFTKEAYQVGCVGIS